VIIGKVERFLALRVENALFHARKILKRRAIKDIKKAAPLNVVRLIVELHCCVSYAAVFRI